MAKGFFSHLDLKLNQLLNAVLHRSAGAPGSGVEGQIYYDTTSHTCKIWNGTIWLDETVRATTAEGLLAPKASPTLTGTVIAPTATSLTNSTVVATTAYADAAVAVEKARALASQSDCLVWMQVGL